MSASSLVDQECKSLLAVGSNSRQTSSPTTIWDGIVRRSTSSLLDQKRLIAVVLMTMAAAMIFSMSVARDSSSVAGLRIETKPNHTTTIIPPSTPDEKDSVQMTPISSTVKEETERMTSRMAIAKASVISMLSEDYGQTTMEAMFFDQDENGHVSSRGRTFFRSGNPESSVSWDRFQRKIMIKILQVLLGQTNVRFVWATGGHSSAAGHGNFYSESYTAFMERAAKDVFAATGIELIGRNYAMGGTSSAMEIALCSKEIFGLDIDVSSWDFGMTKNEQ